jgi:AAA15 family ATPase/GTPase
MINNIYLKDFGLLEDFRFEKAANFNVIIGENDTGKTSLLKILYATSKAWQEFSLRSQSNGDKASFKKIISEKLHSTFQPQQKGLSALVTRRKEAKMYAEFNFFEGEKLNQSIHFSLTKDSEKEVVENKELVRPLELADDFNALFIPAKEVLTAANAISATRYRLFMDGFDDTYIDLINSLRIKTSKGKVASKLSEVSSKIEHLFGGEITQFNDEFIFKKNKSEFSMSFTAEGVKKLGILTTLIRNRELTKGTILFLDEPEAVLHPSAIRELVNILYLLSQSGIQLFISTHSFFVIKQLEIIARREQSTIKCCSLLRKEGKIVPVFSDLKNGMPSNPIIDVALQIFDDEIALNFKK